MFIVLRGTTFISFFMCVDSSNSIITCITSAAFYVLFTVACSFPLTITTMISIVVAALFYLKGPGGTTTVIGQTSTECIMGDCTTLMLTVSIGTHFEDITIH